MAGSWYGLNSSVFVAGVAQNAPGPSALQARPATFSMIMMQNFELQRDKAFALHVYADHPRAENTRSKNAE
jgi:hypothetical protein